MSLRFAGRMARRDARAGSATLVACAAAIGLGVAALVALASLRASVRDAVAEQGRGLLGADVVLSRRRAFPNAVAGLLDSLGRSGVRVARATSFPTMALAPESGAVELLEVRALDGNWPFYGALETDPPGAWAALARDSGAARPSILDPEAAAQLSVGTGDTIQLGRLRFIAAGVATSLPGRSPIRVFDRPRIYIPARELAGTGLVQRGSLVVHRAYLAFGSPDAAASFVDRHRAALRGDGIRTATPASEQERLAGRVGTGTRFLGLVGLAALLLGALGVASGARVLAASRRRSAALLRCLGASRDSVLAVYLIETIAVAVGASAAGSAAGIGLQAWLPRLLAGLLPVPVHFGLHPGVVATGFGVGVAAAAAFALGPLLDVRRAPPLAALRRAEGGPEARPRRRGPLWWASGALVASATAGLCVWEAPNVRTGLAYAGSLALLAGLLAAAGWVLARTARRLLPRRAPYALRQGISNLFRPNNQTLAVVVAIGLATFLVGTIVSVQGSLVRRLRLATAPNQPDLILFDIQSDQKADVSQLLRANGHPVISPTPIATLRIAALDGTDVARLRARGAARGAGTGASGVRTERNPSRGDEPATPAPGSRERQPEAWALGREYRSTWRDSLTDTETLTAGRWWDSAWAGGGAPAQVSLATDIAGDLGVGVGDTITWAVAGRRVTTVVTSLRRVDWARPALNFFAVFQPGVLDDAPATWVILTHIPDPGARAAFQRSLVPRFPNVSAVDLTRIEAAVREVVGTVSAAVRFMTLFVLASGLLVLLAAVWTSRRQRLRESVLLRTLGARSGTIRAILLTEYACLGGLGGLAGAGLAAVAGWLLVGHVFGLPYGPETGGLALVWAAAALAAVAVGSAAGGRVLRRPPLETLRELED